MAARIAFHYFPGSSALHSWDARCKLLALLIVSAQLLPAQVSGLVVLSALLLGILIVSEMPLLDLARDLRGWALLLLLIFLVHALFTAGPPITAICRVPISKTGVYAGALSCWRLLLMLGYGTLFTATTRPRELRGALIWLLTPLGFLPQRRIGFMAALTMRFLPLILDELEEIQQAHKARLGDQVRNPIRRARCLGLPLLRRAFGRGDELALALIARSYREDLPLSLPKIKKRQWIPVIAVAVLGLSNLVNWPAITF